MRLCTHPLKAIVALILAAMAFGTAGCGGGGGGGGVGSTVTVTGRIIRAETNTRPDPAATITLGGVSGQSNATDGAFSIASVSSGATSAVITATGSQTLTLPVTLTGANVTTVNLGDIFLSDTGYTATVTGRVVTTVDNSQQNVAGAVVNIAGRTATTATDGKFTLDNLPVGLGTVAGAYGTVKAGGFEDKPITDATLEFPLTAGANALKNPIVIERPIGSTPNPPYTIRGVITVNGTPTAGIAVSVTNSTGQVFSTSTGPGGTYLFWLVTGTYTISAATGNASGSTMVTLSSLDNPVTATTINLTP